MEIKTEVKYWCPSGFYCKDCTRQQRYGTGAGTYCNIYGPLLQEDANGKLLKCGECLLAERDQRARGEK